MIILDAVRVPRVLAFQPLQKLQKLQNYIAYSFGCSRSSIPTITHSLCCFRFVN